MLVLILKICGLVALVLVLMASLRARRAQHLDISASEIHPDLGVGEELLQDALAENQREPTSRQPRAGTRTPHDPD